MAEAWVERGLHVTYAWPAQAEDPVPTGREPVDYERLPLELPADLGDWLARNPSGRILLGYWELARWLPPEFEQPLVLDYIAPRLLELQFENRKRLGSEATALIELLARCDRVWVGNHRQHDLMLSWMLLAGHDCRFDSPIDVVPIAGRVSDQSPICSAPDQPLQVFHGGRDWPWRQTRRWLDTLARERGPWQLVDCSEPDDLVGYSQYLDRLANADIAMELGGDNIERRFSQSFRMTDALCCGTPVVCNRFLPLAPLIEAERAGWIVDRPEEVPELLRRVAADRDELARRAAAALALARREFTAGRVYGAQAEALALVQSLPRRRALLQQSGEERSSRRRWRHVISAQLGESAARRLRGPVQRWLSARLAKRPRPTRNEQAWVILSRPDLFPTDHGAAVRIERTAWGLSFHVREVLLLTDRRDGYWVYRSGEREWRSFPIWPRLAGWPRAVNRVRVMARGVPGSNAFLYLPWVDRGMQARLMWLIARHPVDVVQGEFPAYARPAIWAARLFGTRAIMVEHNVEYHRIADQEPLLDEAGRLALKKMELEMAQACDRVVTVSERDRRELELAGVNTAKLAMIPHGVALEQFDAASPVNLRQRYSIPEDHAVLVYHGIYSYKPNLDAVTVLALRLLPALAEAGHPARVVAIGPEPPERSIEGVVFTGAVEDLPGYLKGGDLAVIALRAGGGTRMKILDDFAAGVPVISTAKGAEGIPVEHGRHLLICDSIEEMLDRVIELLENPDRAAALAKAARGWVEPFDWREIARRYVKLMDVADARSAPTEGSGEADGRPPLD